MIAEHENARIPTVNGSDCRIEINWNDMVCGKFIRITIDGREALIPQSAFVRFAMLISNEDEQEALIPTKQVLVRSYQKNVTIRLKKDMRAGEMITIPVTIDVPREGQESNLTLLEL